MIKFLFISGLSLIFFCVDRGSKLLAEQILRESDMVFWEDVFRFHLTYNTNLALSIPFPRSAQIILSIVLLIGMIVYFCKYHAWSTKFEMIFVSCIFGGALGNLFDRILFGQVVDFIAVWKFPIFNLADTFIFVGVAFLMLQEIWRNKKAGTS